MINYRITAVGFMAAGLLCGAPSTGTAQDADIVNLEKLTCRTYLMMDGDERGNTALFLHGYISAKNSKTEIKVSDLSEASDNILKGCIDAPDSPLMDMFKKTRN